MITMAKITFIMLGIMLIWGIVLRKQLLRAIILALSYVIVIGMTLYITSEYKALEKRLLSLQMVYIQNRYPGHQIHIKQKEYWILMPDTTIIIWDMIYPNNK